MKIFISITLLALVKLCISDTLEKCNISITTASGSHAPKKICTGSLIFEDKFEKFDLDVWEHENTLSGGGNWEFQWYNQNRTNSFVKNRRLYIRPSFLSDQFGEEFLTMGTLNIDGGTPADRCTNSAYYGCQRQGTPTNIINPIKSARIRTLNSFNFRYGKVEVSAKMPTGDWLLPAISLLPKNNAYGTWPASGEINLAESRGNKKLILDGVNIGTERVTSTLHFGPYAGLDGWEKAHFKVDNPAGFNSKFMKYQLEWTPDYIKFAIDDAEVGRITPNANGFWQHGNFDVLAPNTENPWRFNDKMSPFDQEFYLVINLAVGGVNHFPDQAKNTNKKPWSNKSPTAMKEFYDDRMKWESTWKLDENDGERASLQINYVKVWAL